MITEYEAYIACQDAKYGDKFDASDLAPQFVDAFNTGGRVRVRFSYGEELTGTIGVTTGWRPAFLLMRTSRSIGSPWTLGAGDQIVAYKADGGRAYRLVEAGMDIYGRTIA